MHTQEFINACYNLIDLKIIDLDEYQGFLDNFTTTEELDAYLTIYNWFFNTNCISWYKKGHLLGAPQYHLPTNN